MCKDETVLMSTHSYKHKIQLNTEEHVSLLTKAFCYGASLI